MDVQPDAVYIDFKQFVETVHKNLENVKDIWNVV